MSATLAPLKRVSDLPGPPGWPLVGNLLQIDLNSLHLHLEAWRKTYGDAFRIRLGTRVFLVLADPLVIATALRDRPATFGRTERLAAVTAEMGFQGVFTSNGDVWRRQRPMVMAGFDPGHIKTFFPSLIKVTERFARRWQRAAQDKTRIDLQADLMRFTVDVIAGLAFGADINTLEKGEDVIQQHLDQVLPSLFKRTLAPFSYWHYVKLPSDHRLDAHLAALHVAVQGFIDQARGRMDANPGLHDKPDNLIEAMIAARDQPASGLSDQDVASNVLTMLLAGEDTTANTLAWLVYLLSRNPQTLQRAQKEVRDVLGTDRWPTRLEQLQALDYVEACAHETMRLKPVAPILPHQALRDTALAGIEVPAGTLVMFLMRGGALDSSHFADPLSFDPTRWLAADPTNPTDVTGSGAAKADASSAKRVAMPFGAGPRICPGRYLALLEMKMAMAMLLGSFEIEAVETPHGGEAQENLAFTMSPVGVGLRLKARQC